MVGTAAMAALEATTSPAVKQLLVDTTGTDQWVGAGKAQGGMASGRSQLGAEARGEGRFVDDDAAAGFLHRRQDGLEIERHEGA